MAIQRSDLAILGGVILTALCSVHCSAAADGEDQGTASAASSTSMNKSIASSYGITTFGGKGDYQAMACGGNSRTANEWYVASSQRYGCHVHLQLTASNGKCVVVSTEDAGPAAFVETAARKPILDSSPAVAEYLFGESGLGSSDVKAHPSTYSVTAAVTTAPVGPCSAAASTSTDTSDDTSDTTTTPTASTSSSSSGSSTFDPTTTTPTASGDDDDSTPVPVSTPTPAPSTGGGQACGSDGQCNPGNNGSGLICTGGFCVAGCHTDAQCPGITSCQDGQCQ